MEAPGVAYLTAEPRWVSSSCLLYKKSQSYFSVSPWFEQKETLKSISVGIWVRFQFGKLLSIVIVLWQLSFVEPQRLYDHC